MSRTNARWVVSTALLLSITFASVVGCKKKDPPAPGGDTTPTDTTPADLTKPQGGSGTGIVARSVEPGEMTGVIGTVDGMKPPIVKASAAAPGIALRIAIQEKYEVHQVAVPPQPSEFFALVFAHRDRGSEPSATAMDRRTGQPVGKAIVLLPEFAQRPRPPLNLTPPDLSADGTLLTTHKNSWVEKTDTQPLLVWDVAAGKKVKELVVPLGTIWQGWAAPDRLLTVGKIAQLDLWSYPSGARTEGASNGIKGPVNSFSSILMASGPLGRTGGTPRFAVSADRKKVALPRVERKCYAILDTATGKELGQTAPISSEWLDSIAFGPDGSRLAYLVPATEKFGAPLDILVVADGATGKAIGSVRAPESAYVRFEGAHKLAWWGPDLVVYVAEGGYNVLELATGQVLAKLKPADGRSPATVLPCAADGRLWVNFGSLDKQGYVCAFVPTPEIRAGGGKVFELTPDGIRPLAK